MTDRIPFPHTPGPWRIHGHFEMVVADVPDMHSGAAPSVVLTSPANHWGASAPPGSHQREADLALAAAAPRLLAAARDALALIDSPDLDGLAPDDVADALRAAIAAAETYPEPHRLDDREA